MTMLEKLENFFNDAKIDIYSYNPKRVKKFKTTEGDFDLARFSKRILSSQLYRHSEILEMASTNGRELESLLVEYCDKIGVIPKKRETPQDSASLLEGLVLYKDVSFSLDKEPKFFLGTPEGIVSDIPAHHYIALHRGENFDPGREAIPAVMEYSPREDLGIYTKETARGTRVRHINSYIPPKWMSYEGDLPDKLPTLFEKLINHIFPEKSERKFFFHWVYRSLVDRADTYLVLQGPPAVGKNRLKLHLRALHGDYNSVDGKRSTLTSQFNGQLLESTLVWFDELHYDMKDENTMKEIPNGSISIERKFENSTRSTQIHCSLVISNNKERDNYIAFDARKFSPVRLTDTRLDLVMTPEEIFQMSEKVESYNSPNYDLAYIAQIGRWILKHGEDTTRKNCEYRGPKFWELAHSSMTSWQKWFIEKIFSRRKVKNKLSEIIESKKFLYSEFHELLMTGGDKKRGPKPNIPDLYTVRNFFEAFKDLDGEKIFKISSYELDGTSIGDFYIKILKTPRMAEQQTDEGEEVQEEPSGEDLL
jgi:hypothetical protein